MGVGVVRVLSGTTPIIYPCLEGALAPLLPRMGLRVSSGPCPSYAIFVASVQRTGCPFENYHAADSVLSQRHQNNIQVVNYLHKEEKSF